MTRSAAARLVLTAAAGTFFGVADQAQVGHVVDAQKISDTSGGFTAPLDEEDQFGRSIVNLGDVDGDGVTDLLVGAHTDDDGGVDQGSVYVLFMHPNGFVKTWTKISDLSGNFSGRLDPGDQFGRAAACLGDLDLDGVVDVVVSSNYDDDGGTNKGAVYVLFLNVDGTVKSSQKISSLEGGFPAALKMHDELGRSITALGDMDGDGTTDIVVGTPEDDDGGTNTGALHVLFLNRTGTVKSYKRISRSTDGLHLKPGDWFGHCSSNLGDFDHDGVTDLVVGSVLDDDGGFNQGSIWILFLNANGSVKASHEINELVGGFTAVLDDVDQFGTSVANIGDLDGDGVTDIVVGAVKDDDGGLPGNQDADVGAVYVLLLNADATVKSWVKIGDTSGDLPYSLDQYDWFGSAAARLGGSPGDGLFNVAIGCRNDDDGSPNRGAVYMVQLNDGTAPTAEFAADRTFGVAPLTVHFTDESAGEVSAWVWNFSEGNQSSLQNPTKTFSTPGTYDIQLTARGPKGKNTEKKPGYVMVVAGPLADFAATPTAGLSPLAVQFSDLSEGNVTSWSWSFGDGASSSAPNPQHVYGPGVYTVALTVTGPNGTNTRTRAAYIDAQDLAPVAEFSATPSSGLAPLSVQFDDLSAGLVDAWSWDFGDGQGSNQADPTHVYSLPGTFQVSLTVSGPHGSDSEAKTACVVVEDAAPNADFAATPTTGVAPLGVQFTDLSTGNVTAWQWSFGDGTTASEQDPLHVFGSPGTYAVSLTVSGPNGSDGETKSDFIVVSEPPPQAEFLAPSTVGFAPFTVQFTEQTSGTVTSRTWLFGDGTTGGSANPQHTYFAPGIYTVSLTVNGPQGSSTKTKTDLIRVEDPMPVADFGAPQTTGAAPLVVQFSDMSAGNVSSWWWEFGDGATSAERDPEHVYLLPSNYDVRLTVGGPAGGDDEFRPGWVEVREPPPLAEFQAAPTSGFAPLTVQFDDHSSGELSTHAWDFGDGASSSETEPVHVYDAPGTYDVSLTVGGPGGTDDETRAGLITVLDPTPVAEFASSTTVGVAPFAVQFSDLSSGWVTAWSWSFGDGASSTEAHPLHTYTAPGTYSVSLTASGPAGADTETKAGLVTIQWPAPTPEFALGPVTGFAPLAVSFTDLSTGNITSWSWNFGDGSSARTRFPVKVYNRTGTFNVMLTVKGPGGTRSITHGGISVLALPTLADGGFELDAAGSVPGAPWSVFAGTAIVVHSSASPDTGFRCEGSRWCEIGAQGSSAATPPSNPGDAGQPPSGAAGIQRSIAFAPLAPHLVFDAAFLLGELEDSAARNDFMSVDLSDGITTRNVFHADTFTEFPVLSSKYGTPMTVTRRVHVDLRQLFPGLATGAPIVLRACVGNGGDATEPSRGYVDAFRLVPVSTSSFRNGTGRNAARYLSSPAILGGTWTVQVDVTGHAGARMIQLVGMQRPASGSFLAAGELLVGGKKLFAQSWPALPGVNVRTLTLPVDLALLGQFMATQVTISGGTAERCNAYDLVLGF